MEVVSTKMASQFVMYVTRSLLMRVCLCEESQSRGTTSAFVSAMYNVGAAFAAALQVSDFRSCVCVSSHNGHCSTSIVIAKNRIKGENKAILRTPESSTVLRRSCEMSDIFQFSATTYQCR